MKKQIFRNMILSAAAVTAAISISVCAEAANWGAVNVVTDHGKSAKVISSDSSSFTYTSGPDRGITAFSIGWEDILGDDVDINKVAKAEWKLTYKGLNKYNGDMPLVSIGGGGGSGNTRNDWTEAASYSRFADNIKDGPAAKELLESGGKPEWSKKVTVTDSITFPEGSAPMHSLMITDWTSVGTPEESENLDLSKYGITITLSDFKIYDRSGKELKQRVWSKSEGLDWRDLLKNSSDMSRIASYDYKVTYKGLKKLNELNITMVSGGSWAGTDNGQMVYANYFFNSNGAKGKNAAWKTDVVQEMRTVRYGSSKPIGWVNFKDTTYKGDDEKTADLFAGNVTITFSDLKAYDKDGKEIALKDDLDITKRAPAVNNSPTVQAAPKKTSVGLTWVGVDNATKYRVMILKNGKLKKVADTKDLSYTVKKLKSKTEYTFAVKAYVNGKWTKDKYAGYVSFKTK